MIEQVVDVRLPFKPVAKRLAKQGGVLLKMYSKRNKLKVLRVDKKVDLYYKSVMSNLQFDPCTIYTNRN